MVLLLQMGELRLGERLRDYPKVAQSLGERESCSLLTSPQPFLEFCGKTTRFSLEDTCSAKYPGVTYVGEEPTGRVSRAM